MSGFAFSGGNQGADPNVSTRRGHTALIFAAGRYRDEVVKLLLAHGALVKVRVVTGETAMSMGSAEKGRVRWNPHPTSTLLLNYTQTQTNAPHAAH